MLKKKKKFQIEKGKSREYQDGCVQGISKLKAQKKSDSTRSFSECHSLVVVVS